MGMLNYINKNNRETLDEYAKTYLEPTRFDVDEEPEVKRKRMMKFRPIPARDISKYVVGWAPELEDLLGTRGHLQTNLRNYNGPNLVEYAHRLNLVDRYGKILNLKKKLEDEIEFHTIQSIGIDPDFPPYI